MRKRSEAEAGAQRYRATISYDGGGYAGYQIQPHHPTIQETLETAIHKVTRERVRVFGSGRTDQGVHARGQVIHFDLGARRPLDRFRLSLNSVLPADIRVEQVQFARPGFDARLSAVGKEYRYLIWNAAALTPDVRRYRTHVWRRLDVSAMRKAARVLEGRHDFAAFSANPRREVDGTVRTLHALTVRRSGGEVIITARGDGFLYKMVRSLAGFLIRVGLGEVPPEQTSAVLQSKTRTARVPTAPPEGLFLWRVFYGRRLDA